MAQNPSDGHDPGQIPEHQSTEIENVIKNYRIIVEHVNAIDTVDKREMKRSLLDAITDHVQTIEASLSDAQGNISEENKERIRIEIQELKELRSQSLPPSCDNQSQGYEYHQSPLVLFLSLASEVGKYSASDPRRNAKQSADPSATGQDWGQLSSFLDYLSQLNFFKSHVVQSGKTKVSYWPGLPTCVMALIPLETLYQKDSKIMISASLDRFEYDLTQGLQTSVRVKRDQRLANLEIACSGIGKEQIDSVKEYSKKMKTEHDSRQERITELKKSLEETKNKGNKKKMEAYQAWQNAKNSEKTQNTSLQAVQDLETLRMKKTATDEKAKKEEDGIKEEINTLETENPPNAGDASVPVYLPVIISTWHPDGTYLPTCLLDCHRFRFIRPLGAEKQESLYKSKKREGVYPATSCAEWDGFVNWTAECCRKEQTQTVITKSLAQS